MSTMPNVGELAPEFELKDDAGKAHRLSERRGHYTVVYFYPADDTPGCTKEACSFRDNHAEFGAADTEVWGLSPQGPESKAAFRAKYGLPFTLLADEDHAVADSYGALGREDQLRQDLPGHHPLQLPGGSGREGRASLAQSEGRRPRDAGSGGAGRRSAPRASRRPAPHPAPALFGGCV